VIEVAETTGLDTNNPVVSNETATGNDNDSYSIMVDGEEHRVSLQELQSGYQRQSDYTRKTQELARERERLAQGEAIVQALESDPQGAVLALSDAFGVQVAGNQNTDMPLEDMEDLDPDELRLRRIESSIEEQERATRQQHLQKDLNDLQEKYGTSIDAPQLFSHALKHNIGNLEAAYTHMSYDSLRDKAKNADIVDEKRAANVVDASGGSVNTNVEKAATAVSSIRDAYMLAKDNDFE